MQSIIGSTFFRTQLPTAKRPGEVSKMRWAHLDPALFERRVEGVALASKLEPVVWTIPAKEAKNGLAHEVPLSGAVIELLRDLATRDEDERSKINALYRVKKHQPAREPSEYVFPSRRRKGPIKEVREPKRRACAVARTAPSHSNAGVHRRWLTEPKQKSAQ